jgi:hypothetical protein
VDIGVVGVLTELNGVEARLSGLARPRVKESRMRVKKRVKRGVKKGMKSVKSAPPEAYLAGMGVLVGGAAVLLLTTTKSGRELLIRTTQLALRPEADEQETPESDVQESDVQEEVHNEPAAEADVEEEPEEDTNGDDESAVAGLKPRIQRPRSPRKAPAPRKVANA